MIFQLTVRLLPEPLTVVAAQLRVPWVFDKLLATPGMQLPTYPVPALLYKYTLFNVLSCNRRMLFATASRRIHQQITCFRSAQPSASL